VCTNLIDSAYNAIIGLYFTVTHYYTTLQYGHGILEIPEIPVVSTIKVICWMSQCPYKNYKAFGKKELSSPKEQKLSLQNTE